MLAERKLPDIAKLRYPIYASPKIDGVRALVISGKLVSRALKPIPNEFVSTRFSLSALSGLDGELVLGSPTAPNVFNATSGALRREEGEPDARFYCFDEWDRKDTYQDQVLRFQRSEGWPHCSIVPSTKVDSPDMLLEAERAALDLGYEGLILRSPEGLYKFGRSTLKEGAMLKLKRFQDDEAEVVGIYEEMHNGNEARRNELGRTQRSTHREGLVGKGTTGGFVLLYKGIHFKCGTGLSDDEAALWWSRRKPKPLMIQLDGEMLTYYELKRPVTVKFKHFAHGAKDKPRHPVYLGVRDKWDAS